jgi:hypothetical protein
MLRPLMRTRGKAMQSHIGLLWVDASLKEQARQGAQAHEL